MKKEIIKILLVEDNPADAKLVQEYLREAEHTTYRFVHVERFSDVPNLLGQHDFDVILLDLSLPDSSGIETLNRATQTAPHLPMIMLIGINEDELSIKVMQAADQDYLVKGKIDCTSITKAIRHAIERKRIEKSMLASEDRYKPLFEKISDIYYRTDIKGIIREISPSVQHFGYTSTELIGKDVRTVYHNPAYREIFTQILLREGSVKDFELVLKRKNGEPIDVSASSRLTLNAKGKPNGIEGILRDISERKKTEEILRESEMRYRAVIERSVEAIYLYNSQTAKIQEANPAFLKLLGYSKEEVHKLSVYDIVAHDRVSIDSYSQKIIKEGSTTIGERRWKRKDGNIIEVSVTGSKIKHNGNGTIFIVATDITERKRAEEALREGEEKFRTIFDESPIGIELYKADGMQTNANRASLNMFGIPDVSEIQGFNIFDGTSLDDEKKEKLRRGESVAYQAAFDFEKVKELQQYKTDRVGIAYFDYIIKPLLDSEGKTIHGYLLQVQDITERKQTEMELQTSEKYLRESEERYRSLFDKMMDGVYRSTHAGKFVEVNPAMVKMFGYSSKEEMLQVDIKKDLYFAPSDRDSLFLDTGQEKTEIFRMRRKDGSEIWVEDHGHYVHDDKGNVIFHEGILRDVTERMRGEQLEASIYRIAKAAESAENIDVLFKSVHNIIADVMPAKNFYIALYDDKDRVISFAYFVDEVDVAPLTRLSHRGLTEYVLRTGQTLLCNEQRFNELEQQGEVENVGTPSPIWLGVPLKIDNKTIGVMVVQHYSDPNIYGKREQQILEFVSSEVARVINQKKSEEHLWLQASALESTANAIVITDLKGNINWVNPAFTKLTGYLVEEVRGKNPRILKSGKQDENVYKNLWDTILAGNVWHGELQNRRKDGALYHEEMTITPVLGRSGEISNFIAIKQDITEKKILETQFLRSQRIESIGILAGGIAHDLNNVLAPILMSIEILDRNTTEQQKRMLEILKTSAQRGAEIVKQILTFSRGTDGDRVLIQPKHLVREIEIFTRQTFPREIEIHNDIQKNTWTILGDSTQIHQVLLNLSVNARDAMPIGGKLTITTSNTVIDKNYTNMHPTVKVGPYVLISVSDTGMGIPENIIDKIFDPFFTTKEIGKGTGLGLSTVAGIVKSHNGFINVYSEVGKGTEFKVYLPAVETQETKEATIGHNALPKGNNELILVVDDESSIREITKATLETHAYRVITASDGVEAISLFAENRKDVQLVITDMAMPNMSGTILIHALGKIEPTLKIIATSGLVTKKLEAEGLQSSIKAFLKKPYTAETLLTTLHDVLNKS